MPNLWPTKLYLTKSSVFYRETGFKIFLDVSSCDPGKVHLLLFLIFRFVFNFDKILYFHKYLDLCSITGSPTVCFFMIKYFVSLEINCFSGSCWLSKFFITIEPNISDILLQPMIFFLQPPLEMLIVHKRFEPPFYRKLPIWPSTSFIHPPPLYICTPTFDIFWQYCPNDIWDKHKNKLIEEKYFFMFIRLQK